VNHTVEIDEATDTKLTIASSLAGLSKAQLIARLVDAATRGQPTGTAPPTPGGALPPSMDAPAVHLLPVFVVYNGRRVDGVYDTKTHRIDVESGPVAGSYRTPSEAARAVVSHFKPHVNPNRNGWVFWRLNDNGEFLQTRRHS
jgi:hypothetical protein